MVLVLKDVPDSGSFVPADKESANYASGHRGDESRDKGPSTLNIPKMSGNGNSISANLVKENTKRKRGRPRNDELDRPARIAKWVPKEWTPVYEQIVSLDCMGVPQKKIAEQFNLTNVMVSKICSTPQAKIIRRAVLESLSEKNKVFQEERFARTQVRAMERISEVMEDDALFTSDPFAVVDRAFKLLEKTKVIGGGDVKGDINIAGDVKINQLSQTAIVELKEGLEKARESKELHKDMEAIDVTSPIVERGRIGRG